MLAKKTVKNQITLPKNVMTTFSTVEYFDVSTDGETIMLRPLRLSRADEVRERLVRLGMTEDDIPAAIKWAGQTTFEIATPEAYRSRVLGGG